MQNLSKPVNVIGRNYPYFDLEDVFVYSKCHPQADGQNLSASCLLLVNMYG